ncbi:hypothetical protein ACHAWF_009998 [Thalassiosira exigua]
MSAGAISLSVETLIESECAARIDLVRPDFSGPLQGDDGSDGRRKLLNAVLVSLLVAREFVRRYDDPTDLFDLTSLRLRHFVVELRGSEPEEFHEVDPIPIPSSVILDAILSSGPSTWTLHDMTIRWEGEAMPFVNATDDISAAMKKLGQLLCAIFTQNENVPGLSYHEQLLLQSPRPEEQQSSWNGQSGEAQKPPSGEFPRRGHEEDAQNEHDLSSGAQIRHDGSIIQSSALAPSPIPQSSTLAPSPRSHAMPGDGDETAQPQRSSKQRQRTDRHLFDRLLESGHPASIGRLLGDLIDGGSLSHHPITSFDDVIHELEQMRSKPHVFLFDPEDDFATSTLHFGQRYHGRSRELNALLEIATVPQECDRLDAAFVSGVAGSGKTHLVSAVGNFASKLGVMVVTTKFNRGLEYQSRYIASRLFDEMVSNLVEMRDGGDEADAEYGRRAIYEIAGALDGPGLSSLADFVPSLRRLIPGGVSRPIASCPHWQLIYSLSKLVGAVLSLGRKVMMCADDLQWCDSTTLELVSEVIASICEHPEQRRHLVFVGTYRADEVTGDLLKFTSSFVGLEAKGKVQMTDIKPSTFSLDDVVELAMNELRLPRRLVAKLAGAAHKRSHGSPLFAVQFLNSLVSDSTIAYSLRNRRFDWDEDKVGAIKTPDSVASLIVSNLSSLPGESLRCLRIMSCFGISVHSRILGLLEASGLAPTGGFKSHLVHLADQGIVEVSGPTVAFAHDLIQEEVYEGIPSEERRRLHFDVGTFLGSKTSLDAKSRGKQIDSAIEELYLSDNSTDGGDDVPFDKSTLVSIATTQVNSAGPELAADPNRCQRFARWNLQAGKDAAEHSNFRAASYYYKSGIAFLEGCDRLWLDETFDLSLELHEGCAFSSSALAETSLVHAYASAIVAHVQSFDQSLRAQYLVICSLTTSKRWQEAMVRGLDVLRRLKFDIPAAPTPIAVLEAMRATEGEASLHDFDTMDDRKRVDYKTRSTMKITSALSTACYMVSSPFLPLIACETIRFSLRNGVCPETISALIIFAYSQVCLGQSFDRVRRWADVAKKMLEKSNSVGRGIDPDYQDLLRARFMLFGFVWSWYVPLSETVAHLQSVFDLGLKLGRTDVAYMALCYGLYFSFFRGEHLSNISGLLERHLPAMSKFSEGSSVLSAVQKEMVDKLMGDQSCNPYAVINEKLPSAKLILAEAQLKKHFQLVEAVHFFNFTTHFWMGDYVEAERASTLTMSVPSARLPKIQLINGTFYRGIVSFHFYRDGKGLCEKLLNEISALCCDLTRIQLSTLPQLLVQAKSGSTRAEKCLDKWRNGLLIPRRYLRISSFCLRPNTTPRCAM